MDEETVDEKSISAFRKLQSVTRRLREPGGCEWDRAQDAMSMRRYLLEEVHELVDAINQDDQDHICEELGDVAFLVFFYARLASEIGSYDLGDVLERVSEKLIRRHPHVFADVAVDGVDDILTNWEAIKAQEKGLVELARVVDEGTGRELPALMRAREIQKKVSRVGFDWADTAPVFEKLSEEIDELKSAQAADDSAAQVEEEIGDVLFTVVNLARKMGVDPEVALQRSNRKFIDRFNHLEDAVRSSGREWSDCHLEELDRLWEQSKTNRAPIG